MFVLPPVSGFGISPSLSPTPRALGDTSLLAPPGKPLLLLHHVPLPCGSLKWVSGADRRCCPGVLSLHGLFCPYRPRRHSLKSWGTCGLGTTSTWSSLGLQCNRGGARWCRHPPPTCKQLRTSFGASPWPGVKAGISGHLGAASDLSQ